MRSPVHHSLFVVPRQERWLRTVRGGRTGYDGGPGGHRRARTSRGPGHEYRPVHTRRPPFFRGSPSSHPADRRTDGTKTDVPAATATREGGPGRAKTSEAPSRHRTDPDRSPTSAKRATQTHHGTTRVRPNCTRAAHGVCPCPITTRAHYLQGGLWVRGWSSV